MTRRLWLPFLMAASVVLNCPHTWAVTKSYPTSKAKAKRDPTHHSTTHEAKTPLKTPQKSIPPATYTAEKQEPTSTPPESFQRVRNVFQPESQSPDPSSTQSLDRHIVPDNRLFGNAEFRIRRSLLRDGRQAGVPKAVLKELTMILDTEGDFSRAPLPGDRVSIVYRNPRGPENRYLVLAAEVIYRGQTMQAVRYTDPHGATAYYTPAGKSLTKTMLDSPIKNAKLTSQFSRARKHPILNRIRAHKGIDLAAPKGTAVYAATDGLVEARERQNGYGNVIKLKHSERLATVYAHLSRFHPSVKENGWVKRGQVIGYVGQTGLATGPHLHYEVLVDGKHRNPLTVDLADSKVLMAEQLLAFRRQTAPLLLALDELKASVVAQAR